MLMSGASIVKQGIVSNLRSTMPQLQPCGIDLSLNHVLTWTSPATIDFDNASTGYQYRRATFQQRDRDHQTAPRGISCRVQRDCLCPIGLHGPGVCDHRYGGLAPHSERGLWMLATKALLVHY
ncbi:hypothetical protein GGI35DRAFT_434517 [Trichoderma velutinum]